MKKSRKMAFGRFDYAIFLGFITYASATIVVPVALVALAKDLDFSLEHGGMTAGGALHFGRTLTIVFSMLFCGFIAGRWGKRLTVGWSLVLIGLGMGFCALAPSYWVLLAALLIAGSGEGLIEGLATPFVQDLHPDEPGRYINFTHSFWSVGIFVTVLISGYMLAHGVAWRYVIGAVAVFAMMPALMLLLPARSGHQYPEHPEPLHWKTVRDQSLEILRIRRFWLFFAAMFVAGGGEVCLTYWCASYIQLNFASTAWAGGIGTACFAGGMVVGRTGWGYFIKQGQLRNLIVFSALIGAVITVFFPVLTSLRIFFVLLFLSGIATAPFWPSVQSYCSDCLPQTDTTMLFILLSCAGIPGCGVFTLLMGYIGNHFGGLSNAFYLVPICYLILAGLIIFDKILFGTRRVGTALK